jgi:hypothetical protein
VKTKLLLLILSLCLIFSFACKQQSEEEEESLEWKKSQIKLINDFFAEQVAGKEARELYCPGDGIFNNEIYGVQSWTITDDKATSQQVGRFEVKINCDHDGKKVTEEWTISLFRLSEDSFEYCIYKITPTNENPTK